MLNNTTQNNVTVVVANKNSNLKEDTTMKKINNMLEAVCAEAKAMNVVIAMNKEEVEMKTKDQIREMLEAVGVEMSNTVFKKTKKAELVAMLEQYLDPSKKVEIVQYPINPLDDPEVMALDVSDEALLQPVVSPVVNVVEKKKEETAMVDKKWKDMTIEEKRNFALLDRWNTLVKATAREFTLQSLNEEYANKAAGKNMGNIWRLFYKNTKSVVTKDDYCVLQSRLFAAAGRAITLTYGEENNNEEHVRQLLNVMFFRGYINCTKVDGKNGKKNTIVSITQEQMDSMVALSE